LALLEYYVHSDDISTLPKKILIAKIQFPDDLIIEELEEIPDTWKDYPYTSETAQVFTEFVKDRNKFALKVPSTIVGLESNIILNPLYKEFGKVEVVEFSEEYKPELIIFCNKCKKLGFTLNESLKAMKLRDSNVKFWLIFVNGEIASVSGCQKLYASNATSIVKDGDFRLYFRSAVLPKY